MRKQDKDIFELSDYRMKKLNKMLSVSIYRHKTSETSSCIQTIETIELELKIWCVQAQNCEW